MWLHWAKNKRLIAGGDNVCSKLKRGDLSVIEVVEAT